MIDDPVEQCVRHIAPNRREVLAMTIGAVKLLNSIVLCVEATIYFGIAVCGPTDINPAMSFGLLASVNQVARFGTELRGP